MKSSMPDLSKSKGASMLFRQLDDVRPFKEIEIDRLNVGAFTLPSNFSFSRVESFEAHTEPWLLKGYRYPKISDTVELLVCARGLAMIELHSRYGCQYILIREQGLIIHPTTWRRVCLRRESKLFMFLTTPLIELKA